MLVDILFNHYFVAPCVLTAHVNIGVGNIKEMKKMDTKENDTMEMLRGAVDTLVKVAKISLEEQVEKFDSKIKAAIATKSEDFDENMQEIQGEIELLKSKQILTNLTIDETLVKFQGNYVILIQFFIDEIFEICIPF